MKPYNSIIHSVLIVGLILVCFYLFIELKTAKELLSRVVSTVNPNKAEPNNLNETNVSILLTFIGIGFALFASLTFQSVKDFFHSKIAEIEKKQDEKDQEHDKQIHKLESLEDNMLSISSTLMNDFAGDLFKDGHDWLGLYHAINAILLYSKRKATNEKDKVDKSDTVEGMLKTLLTRLPDKIDVNAETHKQLQEISHKIISNTDMRASVLLTKVVARCEVIKGT